MNAEESVLVPFQQSLASVVFSALTESSVGLQVTATRVLAALGQQPGERKHNKTTTNSIVSTDMRFLHAATLFLLSSIIWTIHIGLYSTVHNTM